MFFHKSNFRYEQRVLPLVFLSGGSMFKNDKSTVLPRFKTIGSLERPDTDVVIVDMPHLHYSCASRTGVKRIINLCSVSFRALSNERFRKILPKVDKELNLNIGIGNVWKFIVPGQVQICSKWGVSLRCHREKSLLIFQAIFVNSRSLAVKHLKESVKFWRWFKNQDRYDIENPP